MPIHLAPSGLQLMELSTFESWTLSPFYAGAGNSSTVHGASVGGTASIGASGLSGRMRYSLRYTGMYLWLQQFNTRMLDHTFDMSARYDIGPRSSINAGVNAALLDTNESLLLPSWASQPDRSTSAALDAPVQPSGSEIPGASALLFGQRILQVAAQAALEHHRTKRLDISVFMAGNRIQGASAGPQFAIGSVAQLPVLSSIQGSIQASYILSAHTSVGLSIADQEMLTLQERARATTILGTVSHQLRPTLRLTARAGASYVSLSGGEQMLRTGGTQNVGGVELQYQREANALTFSADRTALDPYGLRSTATSTVSSYWTHHRPGSSITIQMGMDCQSLSSAAFGSAHILQFTATLTRRIGREADTSLAYAFTTMNSPTGSAVASGSIQAVRLTVAWRPTRFRIL